MDDPSAAENHDTPSQSQPVDLEGELEVIMDESKMEGKQRLLRLETRIENFVVCMQASLSTLVEQRSSYTHTVEEEMHNFIMQGTMLKSKVTSMFEGSTPENQNIFNVYDDWKSTWTELRNMASALTTRSSSSDQPA